MQLDPHLDTDASRAWPVISQTKLVVCDIQICRNALQALRLNDMCPVGTGHIILTVSGSLTKAQREYFIKGLEIA